METKQKKNRRRMKFQKKRLLDFQSIRKFAENNPNQPECYNFLRYIYPENEYPKTIGDITIFMGDKNPVEAILATIELLKKNKIK